MITRGHLIGNIIDNLTDISSQAKQRARLHLFDIHIHVENFCKEILNIIFDINLYNLNTANSNHPGLDLADDKKGWAFQITGDKSIGKIKNTIINIDSVSRKKYQNIIVLVVGEKQGSYNLNGEPYKSFGFTLDMIWDFNDICSKLMPLPIEKISELAKYIEKETRRVKIELEIPDQEGNFETDINSLIEKIPRPQLSNASKMESYFSNKATPIERIEAENSIIKLSDKLKFLPRLTREIFKIMVERRDINNNPNIFRISEPKLRRIYSGDDLDGDLAILQEAKLIDLNAPDDIGESRYFQIYFPGSESDFNVIFIQYVQENNIDLRKPLVILDFSDF